MEVTLSENQSDVFKKIAEEEGFDDFDLTTSNVPEHDEPFCSALTAVSVKHVEKKLELILKSAPNNEDQQRTLLPVRDFFLREVYVYETIFPAFDKFQKERGYFCGFSSYPKIYGSGDTEFEEFLIFENLKEAGYRQWVNQIDMTPDHVALVLKEYGKLHAVSLAMKEVKPEVYENLTKNQGNVIEKVAKREDNAILIDIALRYGFQAVKGNNVAKEALERFSHIIFDCLSGDRNEPEDNLTVIHATGTPGSSVLFKYETSEDTKPIKACLKNWQNSLTGSPALDLSHFFLLCSSKEALYDYKKYLTIYHDAMSEVLRNLHCDPGEIFPFTQLEYHWRRYITYGIYMVLLKPFTMTISMEDYNQRVVDILTVGSENGWI